VAPSAADATLSLHYTYRSVNPQIYTAIHVLGLSLPFFTIYYIHVFQQLKAKDTQD